jgi:hypothetical protein
VRKLYLRCLFELRTIDRVAGPAGALVGWSAAALVLGALAGTLVP